MVNVVNTFHLFELLVFGISRIQTVKLEYKKITQLKLKTKEEVFKVKNEGWLEYIDPKIRKIKTKFIFLKLTELTY